ncbi:MAG: hypothetical protein A2V69_00245 [Candidatus Portnoybacteria bacterium RBG_13_40_8]|uniref:Gfo/Idh/MocA-like oxidoreductase N-terminal domain-containing protein n=1 Tax=Candidatus Portnoybacteria bacterium RBG_13_40_8 TaxID=1801990 RepID=A0A1G2F368_9BACT|nr:MAG: hypothetical protein A2V69_00245 [Candidatus Portnoybacteria bacterium RBG_13_40_8]
MAASEKKQKNAIRFLIVGLGSMGKRRIRNLQYLGETDIIGFDLKEERRKESEEKYHIKTFGEINQALAEKPDAMIISTPPQFLIEYELLAAKQKKNFFSEAGVFIEGHKELQKIVKANKIIAVPSSTFRFNISVQKIKELIDQKSIGKTVAVTYHMGQYALSWHPWEDINESYLGQKDSAGPRKGIPFEFGWLTWVFGDIKEISCIKGKISNLDADIDDVYQLLIQFENGAIGNVVTEVVSRAPLRVLRVVGEEGTIVWDWLEGKVKIYETKTKKWTEYKEDKGFKEKGYLAKENMYIDEIKNFLNIIRKKEKQVYTLGEEYDILKLVKYAEESAEKKKIIEIKK